MDYKKVAEEVFLAGVKGVLPDRLIKEQVVLEGDDLKVGQKTFDLRAFDHIYVYGAGKATALMAKAIERVLGKRISGGRLVVKYGGAVTLEKIRVTEAGHPVPDKNGFDATREIMREVAALGDRDLIIFLFSGGGSALLADCPEGISPRTIRETNDHLVRCGATIHEINTIRKHLSEIKGGGLAGMAYPATMITLVLSDVIGDERSVISSGPVSPDTTTFGDALEILDHYNLTGVLPMEAVQYLKEGVSGKREETPKEDAQCFKKAYYRIIGSNKIALKAAVTKAKQMGLQPVLGSREIKGDCETVAQELLETGLKNRRELKSDKPICLLTGGEPSLKVKGKGLGGRNQHLALRFAFLIEGRSGITFLSAGTDGTDGPTSAAGAVVDGKTMASARGKNLEPASYLKAFDSFHFFEKSGGHIITGATGTNVMDLMVMIIE